MSIHVSEIQLSFLVGRSHGEKFRHQWSRFTLKLSIFWISFLRILGSEHDEKFKFLEFSTVQQFKCLIYVRCWARCLLQSFIVTRSFNVPKKKKKKDTHKTFNLHLKDDFEYPWRDSPRPPHGILYFCLTVF